MKIILLVDFSSPLHFFAHFSQYNIIQQIKNTCPKIILFLLVHAFEEYY